MPINDPVGKESRAELTDWIELSAMAAAAGTAGAANIRRLLAREVAEDHTVSVDEVTGDLLEDEQLETELDDTEQAIVDELQDRADVLGRAYPFELISERYTWTLRWRGIGGGTERDAYLVCLLISAMRDRRLKESDLIAGGLKPARLFQALAAQAAKRFMGKGISFGSPRPDGSAFRDALRQFVEDLGVGEAKTVHPPASQRAEKDEGIDVIAWQAFPDGRPGKLVMYGQVASGGNWRGKPVGPDIAKLNDWFHTVPVANPLPAMFIPFCQHHDFEPVRGVSWADALIDHCRANERDFGLVIDRLRLVGLLTEAPILVDATAWIERGLTVAKRAA